MKIYFNSLFIAFLLVNVTATAQQPALDTLMNRFDSYRKNSYGEKIYLHTDQASYLTGEILWFSAYLTDGTFHRYSDLSKVAYVEILDQNDKPVLQAKIELTDGKGNGSLYLSPTLHSGNYIVRAYTNWMKNGSPEFFFQKQITIINTFEPLEANKTNAKASVYDAQFFPEGGNLIAGVSNTIGFRVIDSDGKSVKFNGALINSANDTIVHFSPSRSGIGRFTFRPEADAIYKAILKNEAGQVQRFDLPKAITSGYTLQVVDSASHFVVRILSKQIDKTPAPVYVFIHARQQMTHAEKQLVGDSPATLIINKQDLAEGISHITLFDQLLNPVSERLVFRQPTNRLSITSKPDQGEYGIRRPVNITLTTLTTSGNAVSPRVSVAVFKTDSMTQSTTQSILDYLWLSSDLKGNVESPEYYLSSDTPEVAMAVDNLMITHGWRKFNWENILSRKREVQFVPEYFGHLVTGTVLDEGNVPVAGIVTYLASPSRTPRTYLSRSNMTGKVQYVVKNYYGNRKLVAHTNYKSADSTYHIAIDNPFSVNYAPNTLKKFTLSPIVASQLLNRSLSMQVSDVFHRDRQEKFINANSDTLAFYGRADESYRLDDYTRFPVMEEVMREYVPGVLVRKRKDGFHFMVMDDVNKAVFPITKAPLMMVDGVTFFDEDEIMEVDPLKVKTLDVMRREYYLGMQTFSGLVSYTTYTGDLAGFKINPHSVVIDYEGLQRQREFYSPRYENQKQRESRLPDQRYLLYWNPSVSTAPDGKAQISFYTSDVQGNFEVIVEGLDEQGGAGKASSSFSVTSFNN
jgi:hypothetical protein